MIEFNRKKTYRRFIYSPVTLFLLCIFLLLLIKALWGVHAKERMSSQYLERSRSEYNRMKDREKELTQSVEYLKTDRGIEAEFRNKFHVVKDGESIAVIVDGDATSTPRLTATTSPSFWKSFFGFFGF